MDNKALVSMATEAKEKAYAPYSKNFRVGSSILTNKGVFLGANIENGSYSMTMCAERTAIFQAIMAGCRKGDFEKIAITSDTKQYIIPCGACLQVLSEFCSPETVVLLSNIDEEFQTFKFKDLLPITFDINKE